MVLSAHRVTSCGIVPPYAHAARNFAVMDPVKVQYKADCGEKQRCLAEITAETAEKVVVVWCAWNVVATCIIANPVLYAVH